MIAVLRTLGGARTVTASAHYLEISNYPCAEASLTQSGRTGTPASCAPSPTSVASATFVVSDQLHITIL